MRGVEEKDSGQTRKRDKVKRSPRKKTYRSKHPRQVHGTHVEKGLVSDFPTLLPLLGGEAGGYILVQALLLPQDVNINNQHHHRQKQDDGPGICVQKGQPKDTEVRIMTLGVVRQSRGDPADPTGTIEQLETKGREASAQPGHDGGRMQISLHLLHPFFFPSLDHHQKIINRQTNVIADRAERGGLVDFVTREHKKVNLPHVRKRYHLLMLL